MENRITISLPDPLKRDLEEFLKDKKNISAEICELIRKGLTIKDFD